MTPDTLEAEAESGTVPTDALGDTSGQGSGELVAIEAPDFENAELTEAFQRLSRSLQVLRRRFEAEALSAQVTGLGTFFDEVRAKILASLERLESAAREEMPAPELREVARRVRTDLFGWLATAIEAQVARQETIVKASRLRSFLSSFDRGLTELPTLSLPMEDARYEVEPSDGRGVRLLKGLRRLERGLRRAMGIRRQPERTVALPDLAAFYLGGPLGAEIRLAANAMALLRVDMWRGCRIGVERLEGAFEYVLHPPDRDPITAEALGRARQEVAGELDVVSRGLTRGADALLDRLERRLRELLGETAKAASRAGTWELPARRYRHAKTIERRRDDRLAITDNKAAWNEIVRGTAAALVLKLRGDLVQGRFGELLNACRDRIEDVALSPVRDFPREVVELLEEASEAVAALRVGADATGEASADPSEIERRLADEHTALTGFISRIAVGETASVLGSGALSRPFDDLFEALERLLLDLPDAYTTRRDPWKVLPTDEPPTAHLDVLEFPFRELCREILKDEVRLRLHDRHKSLGLLVRDVGAELTEAAHFLSFSFEAATRALAEERPARGPELALEGLAETKARIVRLIERGDARAERLLEELDAIGREQAATLKQIIERGDVEEARRRVGQVGMADRALAEEDVQRPPTIWQRARGRVRDRWRLVKSWIDGHLGLQQVTEARLDQHSTVASFSHLETRPIPSSYRRLFETATFGVEDILAGQKAELAHFDAAVRRWKAGLATAVAIVGERGSGRTTLLERGLRRLADEATDVVVKRRALSGRLATEEALATELSTTLFEVTIRELGHVRRRLEQQNRPVVVVLQGLEHVLLRTYDGVEPLMRLLNLISRSDRDSLWVVTVDAAAWGFMRTFLEADDHFTHVIELGRLSRDETEALILRRHRISGFGLALQPNDGALQRRGVERKPQPLTGSRLQRYFDALHRVGGGHPVSTMFAWLDAIVEMTDDNVVVVRPPDDIGHAIGEHMTVDRLLNLAAIMLHGSLSEEELASVTRINQRHASTILAQLQALNLIEPVAGSPDTYTVNPVFYRPLYERLKARRMI